MTKGKTQGLAHIPFAVEVVAGYVRRRRPDHDRWPAVCVFVYPARVVVIVPR
jgi:hypothetical protein